MQFSKIVTQLLSDVILKTQIQSLIPVITAIITSQQLRLTQLTSGITNTYLHRRVLSFFI